MPPRTRWVRHEPEYLRDAQGQVTRTIWASDPANTDALTKDYSYDDAHELYYFIEQRGGVAPRPPRP